MPETFKSKDHIFARALEKPADQRPAFLDGACGHDPTLRAQIEELIECHEAAGSFLHKPPEGAGDPAALLRRLPPVNDVLDAITDNDLDYAPREEWVEETRQALAELRAKILGGSVGPLVLERSRAARSKTESPIFV